MHKWKAKYYKVRRRTISVSVESCSQRVQGLGTSDDKDARTYFSDMKRHMIPFSTTQEGDRELIELAFSKKKADDRKEWLRTCKVCRLSL